MLEGKFAPQRMRVLVIDDDLKQDSAAGHAARAMVRAMEQRNLDVVQAYSAAYGVTVVTSDASIHAVLRNDDDFRLVVDRALLQFYASPKFGDAYLDVFGTPDADTVECFRMPR